MWLDVLDLPLMFYAEVSYPVNGPGHDEHPAVQPVQLGQADRAYAHGGLLPTPLFERCRKPYPMLRYPWAQTRAALLALADDQPALQAVQLAYVNPETGGPALNVLGFGALMLRPCQTLRLPARSPASVFHVIEGAATLQMEAQRFTLAAADTACAPGYTAVTLKNASATTPTFVFIADETPLHQKMGVYEIRERNAHHP